MVIFRSISSGRESNMLDPLATLLNFAVPLEVKQAASRRDVFPTPP
jgi:hypothetical protein